MERHMTRWVDTRMNNTIWTDSGTISFSNKDAIWHPLLAIEACDLKMIIPPPPILYSVVECLYCSRTYDKGQRRCWDGVNGCGAPLLE